MYPSYLTEKNHENMVIGQVNFEVEAGDDIVNDPELSC